MSAPPLLNMPSSFSMGDVILTLRRKTGLTESNFTFEESVYRWPAERWSVRWDMPLLNDRAIASEWIAFGLRLKGRYGTFLLGDPSATTPLGVATGTPVVSGGTQTGNTLVTSGWTPSITGIMKTGDYIQLGTGATSRLHMVVADANSDGSGIANLLIEPALRESPSNGSAVVTTNPKGVFRLTEDSFSWSAKRDGFYDLSFEADEVIRAG